MSATSPVSVAILAFPETSASVVYGLYDLVASAGRDWGVIVDGRPGPSLMRPTVVSRARGPVLASNGITITAEQSLAECPTPAIACVPEINLPPGEPLAGRYRDEIDWLARCHANGATLATACSGAMLLAEAGMLDGLEATTHWAWCDVMRQRHPNVKVHERRALVAVGEYVHTLRLEEAKQMLESGDHPVEAVANEVGYEDAGFFSRLFARNVGLTPLQYCRRFGALRKALQSHD